MRCELYIDVYFAVNAAMDAWILYILRKLLRSGASWKRIAAGAGAGAAAASLMIVCYVMWGGRRFPEPAAALLQGVWAAAQILVPSSAMILAAFRPRCVREFAKELLTCFFLAVCMGGIMEAICRYAGWDCGILPFTESGGPGELTLLALLFMAAGTGFLVRFLWDCAWESRREKERYRLVWLRMGGRRIRALALYDTGNRLRDPKSGRGVSIVSEKLWLQLLGDQEGSEIFRIPFSTVSSPLGIMEAARIDGIQIEGEREIAFPMIGRAPFAVSRDGSYEVLLHEDL